MYFANSIDGKIFYEGKNVGVERYEQLDTTIHDIKIDNSIGYSTLTFKLDNNKININFIPLSAKSNNKEDDHFIFSPVNFNSSKYEIINISFTTCANKFDVMPVNEKLINKCLLSILFKDISKNDIYYWQGELTASKSISDIKTTFKSIETYACTNDTQLQTVRENANEFYYMNSNVNNEFTLTQDDFVNKSQSRTDERIYEANITRTSSNNYFYYDGVPDEAFKTVNNYWSGGDCDDENGSSSYVTYSYQLYGQTSIRTHIMIFDMTYDVYYDGQSSINGQYESHGEAEISVLANETVIYYPSDNTFDLTFDNNVVEIYPSIEWKKTGGDTSHIAVAREFGGVGYSYTGGSATGILNIMAGIIDNIATNGWIGSIVDILSISNIGSETYTFGSTRKLYKRTAAEQEAQYGCALGSLKVKMNGYLVIPNMHNFHTYVWFHASTMAVSDDITWVLHYTLDRAY